MEQKTLSELLKQSWEVYTTHFKVLFVGTMLLIVPFMLAIDLLVPTPSEEDYLEYELQFSIIDPWAEPGEFVRAVLLPPGASQDLFWLLTGLQVASGLASLLLVIVVIRAVSQALTGLEPDLPSIMPSALRDWPVVFLTSVITGAGLLLGFVLFLVPGIILSVYWVFVTPAIVLGRKRYLKAIAASYQLVKGNFWQVFGRILAVVVVIFVIGFSISASTANLIVYQGVEALIATVAQLIGLFSTVFITVYFLDLQRVGQQPALEFPEEAAVEEE